MCAKDPNNMNEENNEKIIVNDMMMPNWMKTVNFEVRRIKHKPNMLNALFKIGCPLLLNAS